MNLQAELRRYLDTLVINGDNIGGIRRSLFMPWDSEWNGIVRDETAIRENRCSGDMLLDCDPGDENDRGGHGWGV